MTSKTVFHFAAWYPHKFDAMLGLFVKRHLELISSSINTVVIFILFTNEIKSKQVEITSEDKINTIRIYLPSPKFQIPFFTKLIKFIIFFYYQYKAYKMAKHKYGKPDIIHVHILTRTAIVPYFISIFTKKRLIITEHWSRYFDENLSYKGFVRKWITELIVKRAKYITVVSEALKNAMIKRKIKGNYVILPNIVNTEIFKPQQITPSSKKIITNITCFEDKSKNISGIIDAINLLSKERNDFELHFVGIGEDFESLRNKSDNLQLTNKYIYFKGLMNTDELVKQINISHSTLLFSQYETFGIVVYESIACGIPVVSTDVAGLKNSIFEKYIHFVEKNNIIELKNILNSILDAEIIYDKTAMLLDIHSSFSVNAIKKILLELYE